MDTRLSIVLIAAVLLCGCSPGAQQSAPPTAAPPTVAAPTAAPPTAGPTAAPTAAPAEAATAAPAEAPAFTEATCAFQPLEGVQVRCGYIEVPENRSEPDGPKIRVVAAVFESRSPNPAPDAMIYLDGGPGGHTLRTAPFVFGELVAPFLDRRDVILFDQRGVGASDPALDCPEQFRLDLGVLGEGLRNESYLQSATAAMLGCRERLLSEGVNLEAFTSAESAADVDDLRRALGYEQLNLYGISYGTRLALTIMRDFPDSLRSVVLDSTVPLQANIFLDISASAERAFATLFDGCAQDAACNAAYPNLEQVFYEAVEKLNAEPITVPLQDFGQSIEVVVTGDLLIRTLFQALYRTYVLADLPRAIYAARDGDDLGFWTQQALENAILNQLISAGMYYSVQCGEEARFSTDEEMQQADATRPEQRDAFDQADTIAICAVWGAREAETVENQPVSSDIPTLVLAGQYDPVTPPDYGREAAKTLSNSFFFEFPGVGHGASIAHPCPKSIMLAFVEEPTSAPDAGCIAQMTGPEFSVER